MRVAIVLAGGRSRRFGADKLNAELDGETLLALTIGAVAKVVDGVTVAGSSLPERYRGDVPVTIIHDVEPFGGPLVALANVLANAQLDADGVAVVVGGDMPLLVPGVLRAMLKALETDEQVDALILQSQSDAGAHAARIEVLPMALRLRPSRREASAALAAGQRSLAGLLDRLAHAELPWARWQALDPAADTLFDVDTVADLQRFLARVRH